MRQGWLDETLSNRVTQTRMAREVRITETGCPFSERCPEVIPQTCAGELPPTQVPASGHSIACQHSPDNPAS